MLNSDLQHDILNFFFTKWLPSNRLEIGISLATCLIRIEMKLKRCRFVISPGASNSNFDIHVELFGCLATSQNIWYLLSNGRRIYCTYLAMGVHL